jgi:TonB family protein
MGYQALLFCPDEKTARTVTQVLGELEFNVEACAEPFAAVKKLMSQHFDAVVVDCDNEQNATLLFKSARNSTSNQGSLAVAVVEGQAGVAKAFRIGANLVLTKPINIEQAKGTLRVARGLLRKGEPAKPGAAPIGASAAVSPAAPVANKSASAVKPEAPAVLPGISTTDPRPRPMASSASPAPTAARSSALQHDEDLLEIGGEDSVRSNSPAPAPVPANKFITPSPSADKFLAAAVAPEKKVPANSALPANLGGGAASAPAPARERQDNRSALPEPSTEKNTSAKTPENVETQSSTSVGPAPTFTFGGSNVPAESSGGKKIFIGIAVAVIFAAAAYFGWTHFRGSPSQPERFDTEAAPASVPAQQSRKPSGAQHSSASVEAKPSASLSSSETVVPTAKDHVSSLTNSASSDGAEISPTANSTKLSSSVLSAANKPPDEAVKSATDPDAQPLVVRAGKAPATHTKVGAADAPAPSMIGIATAGATAPPPDLGSSEQVAPKPLLQTLNVSQGVSRGLLYKKVQPVYPRNALSLRLEGSVELMATISKTGDIRQVKVLSGDSQLSKAATDAVKQWKYKPYLLNGEPVEIQTQVTINFKLPK